MSYTRPKRLYRTLHRLGIPTPLVQLTSDSLTASDSVITSINTSHGGSSPSPTVEPSTLEAKIEYSLRARSGEDITVRLNQDSAAAIASLTGTTTADRIIDRFTGRIGRQTNTDQAGRFSTRLTAATWSAQLSRTQIPHALSQGLGVDFALHALFDHPDLSQIHFTTYGTWDVLAEAIPEATFTDTIDSLTADTGILVRQMRSGRTEALTLGYRRDWYQDRIPVTYPLTLSQALSPATWEQPLEDMQTRIRANWIDVGGTLTGRVAGGVFGSVIEEHDWTHIRATTNQLTTHYDAVCEVAWSDAFRLPTVTIDLLALLSSGNPYHRGQVGMLLSLDAGDSINLSGDWNVFLRGIHVVSGISESITGNKWELTLSLIPYLLVFGVSSPAIPARVWDSAAYEWDTESRTWNL